MDHTRRVGNLSRKCYPQEDVRSSEIDENKCSIGIDTVSALTDSMKHHLEASIQKNSVHIKPVVEKFFSSGKAHSDDIKRDVQEFYISGQAGFDDFTSEVKSFVVQLLHAEQRGTKILTLKVGVVKPDLDLFSNLANYQNKVEYLFKNILATMCTGCLKHVTKFDFSFYKVGNDKSRITADSLNTICKIFETCRLKQKVVLENITTLDLSGNEIKGVNAEILRNIPLACPNIKIIDLKGNDMDWQRSMKESLSGNFQACNFICDE